MEIQHLDDDLVIAIGDAYRSNTAILLAGDRAVLIDALASRADAEALRELVETQLGARVELVVCTHYFSDHLAALGHFPHAQIVAHTSYRETFDSEMFRTAEEAAFFVEPTILVAGDVTIRWGRFTLSLFHNPGHTPSTLCVDIPEADLLVAGDTVVGNIVYLAYSTPEILSAALDRLRARRKGRFLTSHGGVRSGDAIDHATHYLRALAERVREARTSGPDAAAISAIMIQSCLPHGVDATPFEKIYHGRNLDLIAERGLFAAV